MRMTKAGADNKIEKADSTQNTILQGEKPALATKKSAVSKKATATKLTPVNSRKSEADPFQAVRRVWPD